VALVALKRRAGELLPSVVAMLCGQWEDAKWHLSEALSHYPAEVKQQVLTSEAAGAFSRLVGRHIVRPTCTLLCQACDAGDGKGA
jgi:hypothetical protein